MDHPITIPHLVQVYNSTDSKLQSPQIIHIHPSLQTQKVTYQQTLTSESIPTQDIHISQNQIVVSQGLQSLQSLSVQSSDLSQSVISSHVIVPQHMLVNNVSSYYSQYEYHKEPCVVAKEEVTLTTQQDSSETDAACQTESISKKRSRSQIPDPKNWACNVRKLKHQRGEAYVSRRGKYVPERQIKNTKDCLKGCRYKCNEKITDDDRKRIFKAFYSLGANEKKYFILSTSERISINQDKPRERRNFTFKYFFTVKSERFSVCKNFYLGTLAISQKPVYNVHKGKSDFNMPKPDGRGHACNSTHALPSEVKDRVRNHIKTFLTIDSKPIIQFSKKKQFLNPSLSVKKMHNMYASTCKKENVVPVKESMYRKIFKEEFNLDFKAKSDEQFCGRCKISIKKERRSTVDEITGI